jgi:hypothetical protein
LIALSTAHDGTPYLAIYRHDPALRVVVSSGPDHRLRATRGPHSLEIRKVQDGAR